MVRRRKRSASQTGNGSVGPTSPAPGFLALPPALTSGEGLRPVCACAQQGAPRRGAHGQFACTESPRLQDKALSRFVVQFYPFKHPFKVLSGDPIRNHCRGGLDCKPDCNTQATHLWKGAILIQPRIALPLLLLPASGRTYLSGGETCGRGGPTHPPTLCSSR